MFVGNFIFVYFDISFFSLDIVVVGVLLYGGFVGRFFIDVSKFIVGEKGYKGVG